MSTSDSKAHLPHDEIKGRNATVSSCTLCKPHPGTLFNLALKAAQGVNSMTSSVREMLSSLTSWPLRKQLLFDLQNARGPRELQRPDIA